MSSARSRADSVTIAHVTVRYRNLVYDSARWDGFEFRPDDIVISPPPKCGTTWMQMICALLIFQTTTFDRPLDVLSPWVDMLTRDRDTVVAELGAQTHRRFIKSHTPLDGLPFDDRVTYICMSRDPRDVALSWDNHMANMDFMAFLSARQAAVGLDDIADVLAQGPPVRPEAELDRFWAWVEENTPETASMPSLRTTMHHLQTFWDKRGELTREEVSLQSIRAWLRAHPGERARVLASSSEPN